MQAFNPEDNVAIRPGIHRSRVTELLWDARDRNNADGPPQVKLIEKTPSESRTEVIYNFSTDPALQETYRNPWGYVRFGRILEDLDSMAGTVAFKHCSDVDTATRSLLLVTASVDKISVRKPLLLDSDLALAGAVTWVGRSSMEIAIQLRQATPDDPEGDPVALDARFTFVARDAKTNRAAAVNPLRPETPEERLLYSQGEARDARRKAARAAAAAAAACMPPLLLSDVPPPAAQTAQASAGAGAMAAAAAAAASWRAQRGAAAAGAGAGLWARLRALLEEGRVMAELPALAARDALLMRDTQLEYALICQPQQRNTAGRIFGGFLMRRAFELAFSTCYVFCGSRPLFLEVDLVDFRRPVDIGNLLRFRSRVLYTEEAPGGRPRIHVEVVAHVTQPELRRSEVSNTFYFTFSADPGLTGGSAGGGVRRVLPATEEEARIIISRFEADHAESKSPPSAPVIGT